MTKHQRDQTAIDQGWVSLIHLGDLLQVMKDVNDNARDSSFSNHFYAAGNQIAIEHIAETFDIKLK